MKRQIEVMNDDESIRISTMPFQPESYSIHVSKDDGYTALIVLKESELYDLVSLINEIIQVANKRDWS